MSLDYRNDVRMRTSKALAYILRHGGPVVGLTFDDEGFTRVEDALQGLYVLGRIHSTLTVTDLLSVVDDPNNPRFERRDERVRSRFGIGSPVSPPDFDGEVPQQYSIRQIAPIPPVALRPAEPLYVANDGESVVIATPPPRLLGRQRTRQTHMPDATQGTAADSSRASRQRPRQTTDVKSETSGGFAGPDRSSKPRRLPDAPPSDRASSQPASGRRPNFTRGNVQPARQSLISEDPVPTRIDHSGKPESRPPANNRQRRRPRR